MQKIVVSLLLTVLSLSLSAREQTRQILRLPDIPGVEILMCDFHMHTVFSDGTVWPTVRVAEAWQEGLHALAITDHIEYLPHKEDVKGDFNRSYEIAQGSAKALNLTLIRGAEITRSMPPGHLNAIFIKDANALQTEDWRDAVKAAIDQDAFVFWNHPGWTGQQKDGKARWYQEHTDLLDSNWVHGIEVVNNDEYYPEVHQWCLDHHLTMIGNSDVHHPIAMAYDPVLGEHRPMTWVIAAENSPQALKQALLDGRTIVYWQDTLIGKEEFLRPLFNRCVSLSSSELNFSESSTILLQIRNPSDLEFTLEAENLAPGFSYTKSVYIPADRTTLFQIRWDKKTPLPELLELDFVVSNLWIAPQKGLPITFQFMTQ